MDVYECMCVCLYLRRYVIVDCVTPLANIVGFSIALRSCTQVCLRVCRGF